MLSERIGVLFRKCKNILQREGLFTCIKQIFLFLGKYFFNYGNYYIYENNLNQTVDKENIKTEIQNLELKILSTPEQIDTLNSEGYDINSFGAVSLDAEDVKKRVNKDMVLFCIFVNKEIAHTTWVALSREAKMNADYLPYAIDFENEACIGHHVTNPKYRRQGHLTYTTYQIHKFFREKGFLRARFSVPTNIIAVQKSEAKLGSRILAKGRYLKILWWTFWKEEPVKELKYDSRVRTIT